MAKKTKNKVYQFIDTINGDSFGSSIPKRLKKAGGLVRWPGRPGVIYKRKKGTSKYYAQKVSKKKR
jgi:hypothetical protein